jgi:hypothetical protein
LSDQNWSASSSVNANGRVEPPSDWVQTSRLCVKSQVKEKTALAFNHQAQRGPLPVELQCRVHHCCCVLILSFSVSWILDYRNCTCSLYIATLSWVRVMIYKVIMLARPGHRITGDQATQHKAEPPRGLDWQDGWTDGCHSMVFCGSLHMHVHS